MKMKNTANNDSPGPDFDFGPDAAHAAERIACLAGFMTPERYAVLRKTVSMRTRYMTVLAENMYHGQNAAALIRHCEAFGVQEMHTVETLCRFEPNPDIVRGTDQWVDVRRHPSTGEALAALRSAGYRIVATTPHREDVTPETFDKIGDLIIKEYFTKPNYWTVDGKPYFSVYDVQKFVENFGSVEAARAAMDKLREKAVAAGLPGVHWNLVTWGNPVLPGEKAAENTPELLKKLGFDSGTSYVWIHHTPLPDLQTDYIKAMDDYFAFWDKARAEYGVPYYPNVTMGWDPSPRYVEQTPEGIKNYLVTYTIGNNTPENFREALQRTKDRLLADPNGPRILNINSWNEWTEGSYIEPDSIHGTGYLEAIKAVFGQAAPTAAE